MDVDADVAVLRQQRFSGVDADPDTDWSTAECITSLRGGGQSVLRTAEGDEEGVALRVNLHPAVPCERMPELSPVVGENASVPVAELLQKARGSLNVGEQEGDRSRGELRHEWMMRRSCPESNGSWSGAIRDQSASTVSRAA
jgi:hypothetical protein